MNKQVLIILLCLCFSSVYIYAQKNTTITGKVTDGGGDPLIGVSVSVLGDPKTNTVTKTDGSFSIQASNKKDAVLKFSYIGMKTQEIPIKDKKEINVTMEENTVVLDEVVAIGYGNLKRKDLTGSVSSVTSKDIEDVPVTTVAEALKGKIPGVTITSASADQEAEIYVRVRGGISVTQDNSPLYIVDGIPQEEGLKMLNPRDIESIDVLKDAASTAIYGSRGANGVILITTKGGKSGKCLISYDTYWSFRKQTRKIDVCSPMEFVIYEYERDGVSDNFIETYGQFADIEANYANRKGIDWQDEVYGGASVSQMHRISVGGGPEAARYNASYTFNNDGNMIPESGMKTHGLRLRLSSKLKKNLSFGANVSYTQNMIRGVGPYQENGAKLSSLIEYRPTVGIKGVDSDMLRYDDPTFDDQDNVVENPYAILKTQTRKTNNYNFSSSGNITWNILSNLRYNMSVGFSKKEMERSLFFTSKSSQAKLNGGAYGNISQNKNESLFGNQTLEYTKNWKKVRLIAMVGHELRHMTYKTSYMGSRKFPEDNFGVDNIQLGTEPEKPSTNREEYRMSSFFGRANVTLFGKYLFSASLRADGSSKFTNNKWGYFPAAAAAWRVIEEDFLKDQKVFSNLKLRLSYGLSGNDKIGNYLSSRMYSSSWVPVDNKGETAYLPTMGNPDLKWETNESVNLGFEMGFLDNRLNLIADLYNIRSKDLLLDANLTYTSGYPKTMRNIGSTRSRGIEISVSSVNIDNRNFSWTTDLNISFNRTKVLKLADSNQWKIKSNSGGMNSYDYLIEVGQPVGTMYGYVSDGLYQADDFTFANGVWTLKEGITKSTLAQNIVPGYKKYKNLNPEEDNEVNENDMTVIGNANPDFTGGIMNVWRYKNFDLSLFCEFSVGGDIYNANIYRYLRAGKGRNTIKDIYNSRYMTIDSQGRNLILEGDIETLTAINKGRTFPSQQGAYIPFDNSMIENGSYFRFSNVTLGYSLPKKVLTRLGVEKLRFYGTVHNLGVITAYSGYDPEVSMNRNNGLTPGLDIGSSPRPISFVIGANLTF